MKINRDIYINLSKIISDNFFLKNNIYKKKFKYNIPYIISIFGSVSSGKSTTAKILKYYLTKQLKNFNIQLVSLDGFLYCNKILIKKGIIKKKGFPESYNIEFLKKFLINFKLGKSYNLIPNYSHLFYDIIKSKKIILKSDILILEGLNFFQKNKKKYYCLNNNYSYNLIDLNVYINAKESFIEEWYINRFLGFIRESKSKPYSYFSRYLNITEEKAIEKASKIWKNVNKINLIKNILPTKKYAHLIIEKNRNHSSEIFYNKKIFY
ncbi:coaA [Wigglesworthia glossinidia endosymbiont of Glossina brevipalpis]|uniref:Pantothenate kinase n=1 Tax=Wigglesworthia glossinidia brevipalpis TaxID=36870 RepID=Q8D241_WIGBR|nr:coaA [Wigglesworthia glossinidia endosymbiont of Glossina brevipalpis]